MATFIVITSFVLSPFLIMIPILLDPNYEEKKAKNKKLEERQRKAERESREIRKEEERLREEARQDRIDRKYGYGKYNKFKAQATKNVKGGN